MKESQEKDNLSLLKWGDVEIYLSLIKILFIFNVSVKKKLCKQSSEQGKEVRIKNR